MSPPPLIMAAGNIKDPEGSGPCPEDRGITCRRHSAQPLGACTGAAGAAHEICLAYSGKDDDLPVLAN